MYNPIVLLILFLLAQFNLQSQILPKEGNVLNYRLIGFKIPEQKEGYNYKIELAAGNFYSADSFSRHIFATIQYTGSGSIQEVPSFGRQYTWRVVTIQGNNTKNADFGDFHHFSTGILPEVDTTNIRLRIIKQAEKFKNAYVFLDGNRALYDMKGRPVWYLPILNGSLTTPHDLKLSGDAITCIVDEQEYEVNYDGQILWKGPNTGEVSGDSVEHYNHDIIKLKNGHFMTMGTESALWNQKFPSSSDSSLIILNGNKFLRDSITRLYIGLGYHKLPLATVIEYDHTGKVVWSWRYSKYFKNTDIYKWKMQNGITDYMTLHNSLFFDEKDSVFYIGFKAINRIIKVKYPGGDILRTYGDSYGPGNVENHNPVFCGQHNISRSATGDLFIFNNNCCHPDQVPEILQLREPVADNGQPEIIWKYECSIEGSGTKIRLDSTKHYEYNFLRGGTAIELPGKSLFASMSGNYSKVFIVSRDKKILWSASSEKWNPEQMKWEMIYQYRANIITDPKAIERLIWKGENEQYLFSKDKKSP